MTSYQDMYQTIYDSRRLVVFNVVMFLAYSACGLTGFLNAKIMMLGMGAAFVTTSFVAFQYLRIGKASVDMLMAAEVKKP